MEESGHFTMSHKQGQAPEGASDSSVPSGLGVLYCPAPEPFSC